MKGQISIEFLVVLGLMIVIFGSISFSLLNSTVADLKKSQTDELTKSMNLLIQNAVEEMQTQGNGARKTILVRAPLDCDYYISSKAIEVYCDPASASANFTGTLIGGSFPFAVRYDCPQCPDYQSPDDNTVYLKKVERGTVAPLRITRQDTLTTTVS